MLLYGLFTDGQFGLRILSFFIQLDLSLSEHKATHLFAVNGFGH